MNTGRQSRPVAPPSGWRIPSPVSTALFDVGASELFLQNAKKFDVSIADVDFLVISHGHYDHGGGLKTFFKENTKAEVFRCV